MGYKISICMIVMIRWQNHYPKCNNLLLRSVLSTLVINTSNHHKNSIIEKITTTKIIEATKIENKINNTYLMTFYR